MQHGGQLNLWVGNGEQWIGFLVYLSALFGLVKNIEGNGLCLVPISFRGWIKPRAIVRLEELGQLKNPLTSLGTETATFRLVA
jgi:hypothetical protein